MTSRIACAAFLICPFVLGCGGLFRIGTRNLFNEAKIIRDDKFEQVRYACLAHEAWERFKAGCPGRSYSIDYAEGFKAGFVDYLYAGGWGEPPALPPKRYRHFHAESAKGATALQDWYGGFRHGAAVANESGLRRFVVVSLPPPAAAQSPPPPPPLAGAPTGETNPPSPSLPLPTPLRMPAEAPPNATEGTSSEPAAPAEEAQPPGSAMEGSTTEQPAPEGQP